MLSMKLICKYDKIRMWNSEIPVNIFWTNFLSYNIHTVFIVPVVSLHATTKSSSWHSYVKRKIHSQKFFDSIVQPKFSNMFLQRFLPFRHGFTQAWWICIPRWCMGRTAIHERGCDWCKLFPEISWYEKLAFLSSSVSFYDYLKWILKTTFERHQINLFLTFPLFFAEWRWERFLFFIRFESRNEKLSKSSAHIKHKWKG